MNEEQVENAAFGLLRPLGYSLRTGTDIDDAADRADPSTTQLSNRAKAALRKLNPQLPHPTIDAVVASLSRPPRCTVTSPAAISTRPTGCALAIALARQTKSASQNFVFIVGP